MMLRGGCARKQVLSIAIIDETVDCQPPPSRQFAAVRYVIGGGGGPGRTYRLISHTDVLPGIVVHHCPVQVPLC